MRRLIKIVFSRYFISAVCILAELVGFGYVLVRLSSYSVYFLALATVLNIAVLLKVIGEDSNPEYKLTWIAVIGLLPILGSILFLAFYRRRMSRSEMKVAALVMEKLNECAEPVTELDALGTVDKQAAGKAMAILGDDPTAAVYRGTVSRYFALGEDMFSAMLEDIEGAESFVFLEYYIIDSGEMWDELHGALGRAVSRGVEVRLIYDDIGCMGTLPPGFNVKLVGEGIQARRFSPLTPRVSAVHNNRDHRKICVIDGKIGYTGGMNIADEYVNRVKRFGHWKDGGIRLLGDAVRGLTRLYLMQWGLAAGRSEDCTPYLPTSVSLGDGGFYIPFGSGPYPLYKRQVGKRAIIDIINQSKRYLYVTTPYLIIDYDLSEALCGAARRGVDVRIITPKIPDKKVIKLMTKSAYPGLMGAGVSIYEYTHGFIHEKVLVSDDEYAMVGTINFDYRSLVHHFEDAVWIYRSPVVVQVRGEYMKTVAVSHKMTEREAKLKPHERLLRSLVRLFAPLL